MVCVGSVVIKSFDSFSIEDTTYDFIHLQISNILWCLVNNGFTIFTQFKRSSVKSSENSSKIWGIDKKPKILKLDVARSTTMDLIRFFEAVKNPKIAALHAMTTRSHTSSQLMPLGDKVLMLYIKVHLVLCGKIIHVIKISCPIAQMKDNPSCC